MKTTTRIEMGLEANLTISMMITRIFRPCSRVIEPGINQLSKMSREMGQKSENGQISMCNVLRIIHIGTYGTIEKTTLEGYLQAIFHGSK